MTSLSDTKIAEILVKGNYISQEDVTHALKKSVEKKIPIADYLYNNDLLSKDLFGQAIAEYFDIGYTNISANKPPPENISRIPEDIATTNRIVLLEESESKAKVATDNLSNIQETVTNLKGILGEKEIVVTFALSSDIDEILKGYRKSFSSRLEEILKQTESVATQILDEILEESINLYVSDIHFEPLETEVLIRFRVDGVLQEVGSLSKDLYENILNRIKVQAKLRIDEHFSSQDGAIRTLVKERPLDLRVSIVPTLDGEKVVIRVLAEYIRELSLSDLGLSEKDEKLLVLSYKKPFGMILTTGPTGSGKTTTLYSVLKMLRSPKVNITTIEDPVEYKMSGVNQIQVNTQTNLTFAKGLRSIVRQDPNVILVGEIRDSETSEIAINAALTGHLLLSTFHANDAATAIPRLMDMGAEPFLLASTINLIISQRLVRRICSNCRYSVKSSVAELTKFMPDPKKYFGSGDITLYKGKGCNVCNGTGYKGRVAIFELIYMTKELQDLIIKNPSSVEIRKLVNKQGARTFFEDGIDKVKSGLTTVEELVRVAPVNVETKELYEGTAI